MVVPSARVMSEPWIPVVGSAEVVAEGRADCVGDPDLELPPPAAAPLLPPAFELLLPSLPTVRLGAIVSESVTRPIT
jgi:hypothetical protein